jgi:hypothetical protein
MLYQYHFAAIIHVLCTYICHYRAILLCKFSCYFSLHQITCSNHGYFLENFILLRYCLFFVLLAIRYGGGINPYPANVENRVS